MAARCAATLGVTGAGAGAEAVAAGVGVAAGADGESLGAGAPPPWPPLDDVGVTPPALAGVVAGADGLPALGLPAALGALGATDGGLSACALTSPVAWSTSRNRICAA
jgi:hypothetical protein